MAREPVLRRAVKQAEPTPGEAEAEAEQRATAVLRPETLGECIGQRKVIESLEVAVQAATGRGETLDHVLLSGPPGLGKTTLAHALAREMHAALHTTAGPTLSKPKDVFGILNRLKRGDILFIDEIHRIPPAVEEFLYSAMEDFEVDFVLDKGLEAREFRLRVQPFTLVGATTRAGMLTAPLRERFGLVGHLAFYSPAELAAIVMRSAGILKVSIESGGAEEIARRSRGTPRVANRLLRRVRDYAEVRGAGIVTVPIADAALRLEGIDEQGLDTLDRAYLKTVRDVYRGGPVGVEALSATLNEEVDTLVDVVEPYLLQQGWIARTPAGRKLGPAALKLTLGWDPEQPSLL